VTHGSLFTGIGGIDLGFGWAGLRTIWQVEIALLARKVLEKHWPDVPKFADVRTCDEKLEKPDVLSAGIPCQPFSNAGKRRGKEDPRHLWPEVLRVVHELGRPRFLFLENVSGFINKALDSVLDNLETAGYTATPVVLGAHSLGAPHIRQRLWWVARSVGHAKHDGPPGQRKLGGTEEKGRLLECEGPGNSPGKLADADSKRMQPYNGGTGVERGGKEDTQDRHASEQSRGRCSSRKLRLADRERPQERGGEGAVEVASPPGSVADGDGRRLEGTEAGGCGFWSDAKWLLCGDGKYRPTKSGIFPLAHGVPQRVGRLRAYGNAIVPKVGSEFIRSYMESAALTVAKTSTQTEVHESVSRGCSMTQPSNQNAPILTSEQADPLFPAQNYGAYTSAELLPEKSFSGCVGARPELHGEQAQPAQQSLTLTNRTSEVLQRSEMSPEHKQYLTAIGMGDDQLGKAIKKPTDAFIRMPSAWSWESKGQPGAGAGQDRCSAQSLTSVFEYFAPKFRVGALERPSV
jgi:DNA-cytosine methyltransferase